MMEREVMLIEALKASVAIGAQSVRLHNADRTIRKVLEHRSSFITKEDA